MISISRLPGNGEFAPSEPHPGETVPAPDRLQHSPPQGPPLIGTDLSGYWHLYLCGSESSTTGVGRTARRRQEEVRMWMWIGCRHEPPAHHPATLIATINPSPPPGEPSPRTKRSSVARRSLKRWMSTASRPQPLGIKHFATPERVVRQQEAAVAARSGSITDRPGGLQPTASPAGPAGSAPRSAAPYRSRRGHRG